MASPAQRPTPPTGPRSPGSTMRLSPADAPKARGNRKRPGARPPRGPAWLRSRWFRVLQWSAIVGLCLTAVMAVVIALVFWSYGRDLPQLDSLADYRPKEVTIIADRDGQRIGELFDENSRRTFVPYADLPPKLIDAVVATEDEGFWTHGGIDYKGMVRAFFVNLRSRDAKQGASTITQQVVKTFLLTPEKTFKRKIQEIILARRLESELTKQEILTLYLNQIYFGHGRYGVQEAARFYFGKDVGECDVGQLAMLAGLPQSPENLSPRKAPQAAKARQAHVLGRLVATGKLSRDEAQRWIDQPIALAETPYPRLGAAPEWVAVGRGELLRGKGAAGAAALALRGAVVRTTVDVGMQAAATEALRAGLRALDARHKTGVAARKVAPDKVALELAKLAKRLPTKGPIDGEVYDALVLAVDDTGLDVDLGDHRARLALTGPTEARFNPEGLAPSARFAVGDVVRVQRAPDGADGRARVQLSAGAEGAIVVIDLATREVRALVGGYATSPLGFDRARQAERQPGSSFKPFVYGAGIAAGRYTPASIVNDAPEVFDLWRPKNYDADKFEGPVRLRHALAKSINTVAIRVTHELTPDAVVDFARACGIGADLPRQLSIALGSGEVTPLELTNAMATFASGGRFLPPRLVSSIDGVAVPVPDPVSALSPAAAYVTLDMMRAVVDEGTATAAKKLGIPVAGKTGTSNDNRDAWFIGLTADYAIGVWIGRDDDSPLGPRETGGSAAVPVFVELVRALRLPAKAFARPPGVEDVRIDRATGLRAAEGAPRSSILTEVFVAGTAPVEVAPAPGEVSADTLVTDAYDE